MSCFGLCDFLSVRFHAARYYGQLPGGGHHRVELHRRADLQSAGAGGLYQNERQADPGIDGAGVNSLINENLLLIYLRE